MQNRDLPIVQTRINVKHDITPVTEYKNNLDSIKVELVNYPTLETLKNYVPDWANATWNKYPGQSRDEGDKDLQYINDSVKGTVLPSLLETIQLTFLLDGIDLIAVTHILRHRGAAFSADCSGDKMWHEKDSLVPSSIQQSAEIYEKYKKAVELCKEVYCDAINSKKISIMDARYILPRNLSTFYYMHMSLRDVIGFIKQRMDKQIQPETDNLIAYKMYLEIIKVYPFLKGIVKLNAPAQYYINQSKTSGASNLYWPDEDSDIFEWNPESFVYQATRDQLNGTDENAVNRFNEIKNEIWEQLGYNKETKEIE